MPGIHGHSLFLMRTTDRSQVTCDTCLDWYVPEGWYEWSKVERGRFRTHGLTPKRLAEMSEAQGFGCAICHKPLPIETAYKRSATWQKFYIDHDHKTGRVRGILCARCNGLLAGLDDEEFRAAAQVYLDAGRTE